MTEGKKTWNEAQVGGGTKQDSFPTANPLMKICSGVCAAIIGVPQSRITPIAEYSNTYVKTDNKSTEKWQLGPYLAPLYQYNVLFNPI